jgi:hypothetical protein
VLVIKNLTIYSIGTIGYNKALQGEGMKQRFYIGMCKVGSIVTPVTDRKKRWTIVSINEDNTVTVEEPWLIFGKRTFKVLASNQVYID